MTATTAFAKYIKLEATPDTGDRENFSRVEAEMAALWDDLTPAEKEYIENGHTGYCPSPLPGMVGGD